MRRIEYDRYGGPEVMRLADYALPPPEGEEVLIRVSAASINPFDWKRREGELKLLFNRHFPKAMGSDFAGVVEQVGPGVTRFRPGDEVLGTTPLGLSGAFAPMAMSSEKLLTPKPGNLTFEQAATLPIPITTAWLILQKAKLTGGSTVFVNGANGAVGRALVGLAKASGAIVTGRVSRKDVPHAADLGLAQAVDYAAPLPSSLHGRYDLVADVNGSLTPAQGDALRKPRGLVVDINVTGAKLWRALVSRHRALVFFNGNVKNLQPAIAAASAAGVLPDIGETVPITEAIALIGRLERAQAARGKAVIALSDV